MLYIILIELGGWGNEAHACLVPKGKLAEFFLGEIHGDPEKEEARLASAQLAADLVEKGYVSFKEATYSGEMVPLEDICEIVASCSRKEAETLYETLQKRLSRTD